MSTVLLLLITIAGWSLSQNAWKISSRTLPPAAIPLIGVVCGLIMLPVYYWMVQKNPTPVKWNWQGIGWAAAGYLISAIGTLTYMMVIQKQDINQAVSIVSVYPAITFLVAVLFMGEAFSLHRAIGLSLVLAGLFVSTRG